MLKTFTIILGVVFLLVGVLGFIPNGIVGANGIFMTNGLHDIVHLLVGVVLLVVAFAAEAFMGLSLKVFGAVYLVVAVLGFMATDGLILGLIQTNAADHLLHIVLGVVLLGLPFVLKEEGPAMS